MAFSCRVVSAEGKSTSAMTCGSCVVGRIVAAELLAVADGQLEGGALQVVEEDLDVVRVDVRLLGRAAEEVVGMLDDVLIERGA